MFHMQLVERKWIIILCNEIVLCEQNDCKHVVFMTVNGYYYTQILNDIWCLVYKNWKGREWVCHEAIKPKQANKF